MTVLEMFETSATDTTFSEFGNAQPIILFCSGTLYIQELALVQLVSFYHTCLKDSYCNHVILGLVRPLGFPLANPITCRLVFIVFLHPQIISEKIPR